MGRREAMIGSIFRKNLDSDETWYITDNLNLTRKDESHEKNPEKILRNARIDKEGNLVVKRADWTN